MLHYCITNETTMEYLKKEYREKILKDKVLLAKIAQANGKSFITVERWAKKNSTHLTNSASLKQLSFHLEEPYYESMVYSK